MGYIDKIIEEPPLGARPYHFDFFRKLRQEVLRATDEAVISARAMPFKSMAISRRNKPEANLDDMFMRWNLSSSDKDRLLRKRQNKFLKMSRQAALDRRPLLKKITNGIGDLVSTPWINFKYDFYRKHQRRIQTLAEELGSGVEAFKGWLSTPFGQEEVR